MNVVRGRRTFTPLHWCWTVGRRLGRVAVARLSTTLGPWGLLATWPGVPWVSSSAVGVVARCRHDSVVVVCAGCTPLAVPCFKEFWTYVQKISLNLF